MTRPVADPEFEALLDYLKRSRGFDFSGYKRASLMRRVRKQMALRKIESFANYIDFLEIHPEEFAALFNTVLINVTAFFRDPLAWEHLKHEIIPRILTAKPADQPIRVWSAGCASGEEAYSAAMVLAEALGAEAFRERVKIYATDIDDEALTKARQAIYTVKELNGVPPTYLEKYFERTNHRYSFQKERRRLIIFGKHDLIQDAPISRIDLLICRNTLMYFDTETQARILDRFHFALNDRGILFLGRAETLMAYGDLFTPIDLKRRTYAKVPQPNFRDRLVVLARSGNEDAVNNLVHQVRIRDSAFETIPIAQVVVDHGGSLILANERARELFGLSLSDLGRPLQDLEFSYRPVELRSCLERAYAERQPVILKDVEWKPRSASGELIYFNVMLKLLHAGNGLNNVLGCSITFTDITDYKRLQNDLQLINRQLETAYEELQSTNEELETTNEELQSTNEELETMNEELQSTNEELETMNEELRQRGEELNQINGFLESILASMRGGVVVLDRDLMIQIWNHRAEDLWGLRREEVEGKPFLNLDTGLPVEQLKTCIKTCLLGEWNGGEIVLDATNRRGKAIQCRVTCNPLLNPTNKEVRGAILVMEELDGTTNSKPD